MALKDVAQFAALSGVQPYSTFPCSINYVRPPDTKGCVKIYDTANKLITD